MSERLFRGAQPRAGGVQRLTELGINTVINLRGASNTTRAEEAEVRKAGLNYFNISLPNWGRPQDERMRRILDIIGAPESGRVFVHCKDGVDRTGMVVALHRIRHVGWKTGDALAEAERSGCGGFNSGCAITSRIMTLLVRQPHHMHQAGTRTLMTATT